MANEDSSGLFGTKEEGLFGRGPATSAAVGASAAAPAPTPTPAATPPPTPGRFGPMMRAVAAVVLVGLVGWLLTQAVDDDSPETAARQSIADLNGYADVEVDVEGDVLTLSGQIPNDESRRVVLAAVEGIDGVGRIDDELEVTRFAASPGDNLRAGLEADLDPAVVALPVTVTADDDAATDDASEDADTDADAAGEDPADDAAENPDDNGEEDVAAPTTTAAPVSTTTTATPDPTTTTTFGGAEVQIEADNALAVLGLADVRAAVDVELESATLTGSVPTGADAQRAVDALLAVDGIASVDDQLVVLDDGVGDNPDGDSGDDATNGEGDADPDDAGDPADPADDADDGATTDDDAGSDEPADAADDGDAATPDGDSSDQDSVSDNGDGSGDASNDDGEGDGASSGDPADDGDASANDDEDTSTNDDADAGDGESPPADAAAQLEAASAAVETFEDESPVRFALGSAGLSDSTRDELAALAEVLIENPAAAVEIAGHTCDLGPSEKNQRLSEQRAMSVADFLIDQGVDPTQIQTIGFGEARPAFDNGDPNEAPNNRRVEITVLR